MSDRMRSARSHFIKAPSFGLLVSLTFAACLALPGVAGATAHRTSAILKYDSFTCARDGLTTASLKALPSLKTLSGPTATTVDNDGTRYCAVRYTNGEVASVLVFAKAQRNALAASIDKGMESRVAIPGVAGGLYWQGTLSGDAIFLAGRYVVELYGASDVSQSGALANLITPRLA